VPAPAIRIGHIALTGKVPLPFHQGETICQLFTSDAETVCNLCMRCTTGLDHLGY
jgi:hypothetical protein